MLVPSHTITQDHILSNTPYLASPNVGDLFSPSLPDTIILHYTACSDADRAIHMLRDPEREVSAHLVVDRSGATTQLVPFNQIAWHAGKSMWKGRESLNKYSLGIEIVNAGPLTLEEGKFYTWDKLVVPNVQVQPRLNNNSECEYWHKYTSEQILSVKEICLSLIKKYGIKEILAHSDIAPDRKKDPGPVFLMEEIQECLLS